MIQVRNNIFETNSSSVHSITVSRNNSDCLKSLPLELHFNGQTFGWEWEIYSNTQAKANYLFTLIVEVNDLKEIVKYQNKIKDILSKWNVKATFDKVSQTWDSDIEYMFFEINGERYYIDHSTEKAWIIDSLLENEDMLMTYLFSPLSYIATGNDNDEMYLDCPTHGSEVLLNTKL